MIKFLIPCFAFLVISCHGSVHKPITATKGSLLHQSGDGYTLFFNAADTTFYLVQHKDTLIVPSKCSFVAYQKDSLTIKDLSTSQFVHYKLDENVYGIGHYIGNEFMELLTNSSRNGIIFRTNLADLIGLMSCLCHPVGEVHTCAHGGNGTQACDHRLGRKVGYETWIHICEINCSQGYNACCN